jgi:hypothetical protein
MRVMMKWRLLLQNSNVPGTSRAMLTESGLTVSSLLEIFRCEHNHKEMHQSIGIGILDHM